MKTSKRYPPEVRERAVRLVQSHLHEYGSEWEAIQSVASKIGCTDETLRRWVRRSQIDSGERAGLTTSEREELKRLKREVKELKQTNEILRKASAFFAQAELDRKPR